MIIVVSIISAISAAAIMTYVSLTTPLGPWIEPVLVMAAAAMLRFVVDSKSRNELLAAVAASGGVAGIIAIGCSFAFPTIFFLDPIFFRNWLRSPIAFITAIVSLILVAGLWASLIVRWCEREFLKSKYLTFPVAQLINKIIISQESVLQGIQLFIGMVTALIFTLFWLIFSWIPSVIILFNARCYGFLHIPTLALRADMLPLLVSLGFVTGHMIALPLIVGAAARVAFISPFHCAFFAYENYEHCLFAWCAGMVLYSVALGTLQALRKIKIKNFIRYRNLFLGWYKITPRSLLVSFLIISAYVFYFKSFNFSLASIFYLGLAVIVCCYQIMFIAGEIGLAPLGRFATFVMIPGIVLFGHTSLQATLVATFIEVCGGICVEFMFGRKLIEIAGVSRRTIIKSQYIGLVVGALTVGIVFWLLSSTGGLGIPPLVAQRAQTRALLIGAHHFNIFIMMGGALFCGLLHSVGINSVLVMSGIIMPLDYVVPLMLGGCMSLLTKDREKFYPFFSGVFAATSLILIVKTIFY